MAPTQTPSVASEPSPSTSSVPPVIRKDEVTPLTTKDTFVTLRPVTPLIFPQIEEEPKASEARADGAVAVEDVSQVPQVKADEDKEEQKDGKKKKNRCASCNKKVGLTGK